MLSWLQVKLNIFACSLACSLCIHAIVLLALLFCGSYTQLKHTYSYTHLYTGSSNAFSHAKQCTPVRLGKMPNKAQVSASPESSTHTPVSNISSMSNASNVSHVSHVKQVASTQNAQVQADTKVDTKIITSVMQESKSQEHVQKKIQKRAAQASTKSAVQNKKTASAKSINNNKQATKRSTKQTPVATAGQFSPLKKGHTKLLRSKERQKSRVQANKEPMKKQAEKQQAKSVEKSVEATPVVQNIESVAHKAENTSVSIAQENIKNQVKEHDANMHVQAPVQAINSADQPSQVIYTSSVAFERPEQRKAYTYIIEKIQTSYSKPPGFDSSLPFTLTFKIAYATGKPHDISPRPDHVPLLVYQSAKASITEMVYPQELWGTEPEIPFY